MSLKTRSRVNPTILKGRRISQTRGKKISIKRASGQQTTSNRHQRARAIKVLMGII
jgi:hypothetical protein